MASTKDFIPYPTNRIVGTIDDVERVRAAIEALADAGFNPEEIDVLHGEGDLQRLDPTGEGHGFFARFQRTLIRTVGAVEEFEHLSGHIDDVRAGRFIVMVLARKPAQRAIAAEILSSHGAESVGFYGRWAYQAFEGGQTEAQPGDRWHAGEAYELRANELVTRIRVESDTAAVISDGQGASSELRANVSRIASEIVMLSWQDESGAPIVHVVDLARGIAHAVLREPDGQLRHVTGTVHRSR
jgi:hypothetical protein